MKTELRRNTNPLATITNKLTWLDYLQIGLALLLFLCLLPMPYSYYEFIRISAIIVFGLMAVQAFRQGKLSEMVLCIGLILLFQPLQKISLGKTLWNTIDVILGIWLILSVFLKPKKPETEKSVDQ